MMTRRPSKTSAFLAVLCVVLIASLLLTSATTAQNGVTNAGVQNRIGTMASARSAIEVLVKMMAGRTRFDRAQARSARRNLIRATGSIPAVFKHHHSDPLSRANPDIWAHWDDFQTRADSARRAAKQLNADRLEALRATLPDMISACLGCHQVYRLPR